MNVSDVAMVVLAVTSVATLILSLITHTKIEEVQKQTNSLKDELVDEVRVASIAKGRLDEINDPTTNQSSRKETPS